MNINLSLTLDQINTIMFALSKQSYDTVADLIATVRKQAEDQLAAAQQPQTPQE